MEKIRPSNCCSTSPNLDKGFLRKSAGAVQVRSLTIRTQTCNIISYYIVTSLSCLPSPRLDTSHAAWHSGPWRAIRMDRCKSIATAFDSFFKPLQFEYEHVWMYSSKPGLNCRIDAWQSFNRLSALQAHCRLLQCFCVRAQSNLRKVESWGWKE